MTVTETMTKSSNVDTRCCVAVPCSAAQTCTAPQHLFVRMVKWTIFKEVAGQISNITINETTK